MSSLRTPGISWQRCADKDKMAPGELVKQRKVVSRQSNKSSVTGANLAGKQETFHQTHTNTHKHTTTHTNTAVRFVGEVHETGSTPKLTEPRMQTGTQQLDQTLLYTTQQRKHVLAFVGQTDTNRRHVKGHSEQSTESEQSPGLTLVDKIRAFKALLSPTVCGHIKHGLSDEQVQQFSKLSNCLEDAGNCVKFKSTSSSSKKTGSFTPGRSLDEFQILYEKVQEKARDKNTIDSQHEMTSRSFNEVLVMPLLINDCVLPENQLDCQEDTAVDFKLNELQRTYEEDRKRREHLQSFHKTLPAGIHIWDPLAHQDSDKCGTVKSLIAKETGKCDTLKSVMATEKVKQIIQRPLYNCEKTDSNKVSNCQTSGSLENSQKSNLMKLQQELDDVYIRYAHTSPRLTELQTSPRYAELANEDSSRLLSKNMPVRSRNTTPTFCKASTNSHLTMTPVSDSKVLQPGADLDVLRASLCSKLENMIEPRLSAAPSHSRSKVNNEDISDVKCNSAEIRRFNSCSRSAAGMPAQVAYNQYYQTEPSVTSSTLDLKDKHQEEPQENCPSESSVDQAAASAQFGTGHRKQTNLRTSVVPGKSSIVIGDKPAGNIVSRNLACTSDNPKQMNLPFEAEFVMAGCSPLSQRHECHRKMTACRTGCQCLPGSCGTNVRHKITVDSVTAKTGDIVDVGGDTCNVGIDISDDVDDTTKVQEQRHKYESSVQAQSRTSTCLSSYTNSRSSTYHSHSTRVRPQKAPASPVEAQLPGKLSDYTSLKNKPCKEMSDGNTAIKKRIIIKRPIKEESNKGRHSPFRESEKGKIQRSKSAYGVFLSDNKSPAQSKSRLSEIQRPHSCLDDAAQFTSKYARHRTTEENQKYFRGKQQSNRQVYNEDAMLLGDKVHKLHSEIKQRLESKENVVYSCRLLELIKDENSCRSGHETCDTSSTVKGQGFNGFMKTSVFSTSTPIKYTNQGSIFHDTNSLFAESVPNHLNTFEDGWTCDQISDKHKAKSENQSSNNIHNFNGFLTNSLKKIIADKNNLVSNVVTQDLRDTVCKNNFRIAYKTDPDLAAVTEPHQLPENNQPDHFNHSHCKISTNYAPVSIFSSATHPTNHISSGTPVSSFKPTTHPTNHISSETPVSSFKPITHSTNHISSGTPVSSFKPTTHPTNHISSGTPVSSFKPTTHPTNHISYGYPVSKFMLMKYIGNDGRASPAESLLVHLDDPKVVSLLQKLYSVDYETRQIIMIKVQIFKAWQWYTVSCREHRARKDMLAHASERFCTHRLLTYHLTAWRSKASHSSNMRQAIALCHLHGLRKGFRALRWSVRQSKYLSHTLEVKVEAIRVKASFQKWKTEAERQQQEHLRNVLNTWRRFVSETQKIRHMTEIFWKNVKVDVLRCWRKKFNKRVKKNMADSRVRTTLLRQTFASWQAHFSQQKEKRDKYSLAVSQHQRILLKSNFLQIVTSFDKAQKARAYARQHRLSQVFWAWKRSIQVCRLERQAESTVSREHWEKQTQKRFFVSWRDNLVFSSAAKTADIKLCRKCFFMWNQAWKRNLAHYQTITRSLTRIKLHYTILTWRNNVAQLRKRYDLAVAVIERCHLKLTWQSWKMYISAKATLRRRAQLHQIATQHAILASKFSQWQHMYNRCSQEKLAKQLWSETCARQVARQWKLISYRGSLLRLCDATQPEREHRMIRAMFGQWVNSLQKRQKQMQQAVDLHEHLERCHLMFVFRTWKEDTHRAVTIKPLVQRAELQLLMEHFLSWRNLVKHKSKCQLTQRSIQARTLHKFFYSWRRQLQVCQTEKSIKYQMSHSLLLCLFREWWFLIHRKKKGHRFNILRLLRETFDCWKDQAGRQYLQKVMIKKEEEANQQLKRQYFIAWLESTRLRVSVLEQHVDLFVQKHGQNKLSQAFISWRQHMQLSLIARAYQVTHSQRLLLTLFSAWHQVTKQLSTEAVQKFSDRIGIINESTARHEYLQNHDDDDVQDWDSESSPRNMSLSLSHFRSSFPGQFHQEDHSQESDHRMTLLSGGLQASADVYTAKCKRLKETAAAVIHRLKHWPIFVAFEQWKQFVARGHMMKSAYIQLHALHISRQMSSHFREWRSKFRASKTATEHKNAHLLSKSLKVLCMYKNHRKWVKHQTHVARQHHTKLALRKHFPKWLHKTQVRVKENQVLHLWTSCTAREVELSPLENCLRQKREHRSLRASFNVWLVKYQVVVRIRNVYHGHLLAEVFTSWQHWAQEKHGRAVRALTMLQKRRTWMTFKFWLQRLHQSKETDRRYHVVWKNYLFLILQKWRAWAKTNHKLRISQRFFELHQSQRDLQSYFYGWKCMTEKVKEIRSKHIMRLKCSNNCLGKEELKKHMSGTERVESILLEWKQIVNQIKVDKQTISHFQIYSDTLLVRALFHRWHVSYTKSQLQQQQRKHFSEKSALSAAMLWKRKSQLTRGAHLRNVFLQQKMASCFQRWKSSLALKQSLHNMLDVWTQQKDACTVRQSLRRWRTQVIAGQAGRAYTFRLRYTVMVEWRSLTLVSKVRHNKSLAMKKRVEERSLQVFFQYWLAVTRLKQSVQHNLETKLLKRILRRWKQHTKRMCYLHTLQERFVRRTESRIKHRMFRNIRQRADYCVSLQEMADKVARDKTLARMRTLLYVWKGRLHEILAFRCYQHILAVRGVQRWQKFLSTRKQMRLEDEQNLKTALDFHHKKICKTVFAALKLGVEISHLTEQRRQNLCLKYARLWKHHVDMDATSLLLVRETALRHAWSKWRQRLVQTQSSQRVDRQLCLLVLSQVFNAWRSLCWQGDSAVISEAILHKKKQRSSLVPSSVIPVSISRMRSSPSANINQIRSSPTANISQTGLSPTANISQTRLSPSANINQTRQSPTANINQTRLSPIANINQTRLSPIANISQTRLSPTANINQTRLSPTTNINQTRSSPTANISSSLDCVRKP